MLGTKLRCPACFGTSSIVAAAIVLWPRSSHRRRSSTVRPVAEAKAWDLSTTLTGTGDSVHRLVSLSAGPVTLELTYNGNRNFIVQSYSDDGSEGLANEIGEFTGEVLLPGGTFLLEVTAGDGTWTATQG